MNFNKTNRLKHKAKFYQQNVQIDVNGDDSYPYLIPAHNIDTVVFSVTYDDSMDVVFKKGSYGNRVLGDRITFRIVNMLDDTDAPLGATRLDVSNALAGFFF